MWVLYVHCGGWQGTWGKTAVSSLQSMILERISTGSLSMREKVDKRHEGLLSRCSLPINDKSQGQKRKERKEKTGGCVQVDSRGGPLSPLHGMS